MKSQPEHISTAVPPQGGEVSPQSIDDRAPERLDPDHRAAIAAGREQIRRGEIASDEEIEAAFRRFDP